MSRTSYDAIGLACACGSPPAVFTPSPRHPFTPSAQTQSATTGWVAPHSIYERMRAVQASAAALDVDVRRNVIRPVFRAAWDGWYDNWQAFFHRYQDSDLSKLGALFYTDDLDRQTDAYAADLDSWYEGYGKERTAGGTSVPAATGRSPSAAAALVERPKEGKERPSFVVPWWLWVLGGVGIAGGMYWAWRKYVRPEASYRLQAAAGRDADPIPPMTLGKISLAEPEPAPRMLEAAPARRAPPKAARYPSSPSYGMGRGSSSDGGWSLDELNDVENLENFG